MSARHALRVEPDAPIDYRFTPGMLAVLRALAEGPLYRWRGGYVRHDQCGQPKPPIFATVSVNAIIDRGLARKFTIIASGPRRIQVTATGEGAWYARTAKRMEGRAS